MNKKYRVIFDNENYTRYFRLYVLWPHPRTKQILWEGYLSNDKLVYTAIEICKSNKCALLNMTNDDDSINEIAKIKALSFPYEEIEHQDEYNMTCESLEDDDDAFFRSLRED